MVYVPFITKGKSSVLFTDVRRVGGWKRLSYVSIKLAMLAAGMGGVLANVKVELLEAHLRLCDRVDGCHIDLSLFRAP